jgi:hypothetical protein
MIALRQHISKYKDPKDAEKHAKELRVKMSHFEEAMKKIRPLSSHELNLYKRIAEQFGRSELSRGEMVQKDNLGADIPSTSSSQPPGTT